MAGFPLGVQVEFNIDGQGWTDVTSDVRTSDPIKITGGRRDESAKVTPGGCTFKLNNKDGRYSDKNPLSPYFGKLGRNTPIRVSVDGDESYLELDGVPGDIAQTPDTAALDITGDIDVRFEITTDWYAPGQHMIIGKYGSDTDQRSWQVRLVDGVIRFVWSPDGVSAPWFFWTLPSGLPERQAMRFTLQADDGAGNLVVTFYMADTLDGPWAQFGAAGKDTATTTIFASTAPLQIAPSYESGGVPRVPFVGRGHRFEVRDGIDGTVVAAPDFRSLPPGTTAFTDAAGLPWTVDGGARVTDRAYRFTGEVSAWPQRWDVSGQDAWVPLTAAGVLRRMGQGTKALLSTLRRRIPDGGPDGQVPRAYWPMEEGRNATQAYSPLPGVAPLETAGLNWASDDSMFGSDALPTLGQRASIYGRPGAGTPQLGGWTVDMSYLLDALPDTPQQMLRVRIGGAQMATAKVLISTAGITMAIYDGDGALLASNTFSSNPSALAGFVGKWNRLQMFSGTYGGDTYVVAYWRDVITGVAWWSATFYSGGIGILTAVDTDFGDNLSGMAIGHLGIWGVGGTIVSANAQDVDPSITYFDDADDGYESEYTLDRMRRLSAEEDLPLHITGDTVQTERVGPQRVDTILNLIQSAADVDGGLLHEQRDSLILAYRARHTLYNQTPRLTLDYEARGEVMPPLEPTEDDQNTRNDVTVKRQAGSSARAVQETGPLNVQDPPAGVGRYDTEVTLNAWADSQLQDLAGWRLHLGTWDGARYPSVHVALHAAPHLISQVLALGLLDRMQIVNPPRWVPPEVVDLLVEGYTETLGEYSWDLVFNCSPAGLWTVGTVAPDDPVEAGADGANRADTSGCEVALDAAAADTVLVVHTPQDGDGAHARWVESAGPGGALPGEFPFDVTVAGERVQVAGCEPRAWDLFNRTAPAAYLTDGFDRTVSGGWGTADTGQPWTTSGGAAADYEVAPSSGRIVHNTAGVFRIVTAPQQGADFDLRHDFEISAAPAGDSTYMMTVARYTDDSNCWFARVQINTSGAMVLTLRKRTPQAETELASLVTGLTFTAGTVYWVRLAGAGSSFTGKLWADGTTEPGWQVTATDTEVTAAGSMGVRTLVGAGSTNTLPVTMYVDSFTAGPAGGWGTMSSGKVWNTTGGAPSDYSVDGDTGLITLTDPASNVRFGEYFDDLGDCELLMLLSVDQTAAGGDLIAGGFTRAAGSAFYWCDVAFQADGTLGIEVRSNTAVVDTREATPYSYAPGDRVWLRMRTVGDRVLGRVWPDGTAEPGGWHIDRTITVGTSESGTVGVAAASTATNTDAVISVHEFRLVDPQQMTVTRALNGVTKPQTAGGDVRLTQPSIVAL